MEINFKLGENSKLPTQNHAGDAGYDVYAAVPVVIPGKSRAKIDTNLSWEPIYTDLAQKSIMNSLGLGVYIDVRDRSGNSYKKGLLKMAGVIDEPYRGNIGVVLYNTSDDAIMINIGDPIAQIIFSPCYHPRAFNQVEELGVTTRSDKGYGSSGMAGVSFSEIMNAPNAN